MKIKSFHLYLLFFCFCLDVNATVENSIIPVISSLEQGESLTTSKYCSAQYAEIQEGLDHKKDRLRIATFNILGHPYDAKTEDPAYRWPARMPRVVEVIKEMKPDILGVQEMYPKKKEGDSDQVADLFTQLEEYCFYGEYSNDGELNGIFYKTDRFDIVKEKVWKIVADDLCTLTMLQLQDMVTNKKFAVFNLHMTFSNPNEREQQALFIANTITKFAKEMPVLLMGDLNLFPNRPDLTGLPFYDGDYIDRILTRKVLRNAKDLSLLGHVGPFSTFTNAPDSAAPFKGYGTPGVMLDRIYVSGDVNVLIHAVQPGKVNGHFASDHMPLLIDCYLK